MAANHSITVSPDEIERWLTDFGQEGHVDPYAGSRTEITVEEAERLALDIAEGQMAEDPEARTVDFMFVREALLGGDYHLALSDRLEPFISAAFQGRKRAAGIGHRP